MRLGGFFHPLKSILMAVNLEQNEKFDFMYRNGTKKSKYSREHKWRKKQRNRYIRRQKLIIPVLKKRMGYEY